MFNLRTIKEGNYSIYNEAQASSINIILGYTGIYLREKRGFNVINLITFNYSQAWNIWFLNDRTDESTLSTTRNTHQFGFTQQFSVFGLKRETEYFCLWNKQNPTCQRLKYLINWTNLLNEIEHFVHVTNKLNWLKNFGFVYQQGIGLGWDSTLRWQRDWSGLTSGT